MGKRRREATRNLSRLCLFLGSTHTHIHTLRARLCVRLWRRSARPRGLPSPPSRATKSSTKVPSPRSLPKDPQLTTGSLAGTGSMPGLGPKRQGRYAAGSKAPYILMRERMRTFVVPQGLDSSDVSTLLSLESVVVPARRHDARGADQLESKGARISHELRTDTPPVTTPDFCSSSRTSARWLTSTPPAQATGLPPRLSRIRTRAAEACTARTALTATTTSNSQRRSGHQSPNRARRRADRRGGCPLHCLGPKRRLVFFPVSPRSCFNPHANRISRFCLASSLARAHRRASIPFVALFVSRE